MAETNESKIKGILTIFLVIIVFYLLKSLSLILMPLVFAMIFVIIFQPVVIFLKKKKFPIWLIVPIISIFTLIIFAAMSNVVIQSSISIANDKDTLIEGLNAKIENLIFWSSNALGIDINPDTITGSIGSLFNTEFIKSAVGDIASSVGSFTGSFVMFALYYVVLLSGISNYETYLAYLSGKKDGKSMLKNFEKINESVFSYILIKTIISLVTGVFAGLICYAFGVKFPIFWGFITFILNYVPSIGSTIATIPPVLMAFIQFDGFHNVFFLLILLGTVQFTMGNVVEPRVMGSTLRLNTVTVIFGMVFWGYIWGIAGMMISVPLMVIMKLTFEKFPSLELFGRLMGYPEKKKFPAKE